MAHRNKTLLIVAALLGSILVADGLRAEDGSSAGRQRRGFLLGLNAGGGSAGVSLEVAPVKVEGGREGGFFGGWRAGYAVSNSLALTVEGRNYYRSDTQGNWQMYGAFATLTWWPDASGFLLRLGVGSGRVKTNHLVGNVEIPLDHEDTMGLFGLGYEWQVGSSVGLGINFDVFGGSEKSADEIAELRFLTAGFSLQLNWYI